MTKPLKITDPIGLDAAKDFAQTRKQMQKDFALLQLKQSKEVQDFMGEYHKRFRELFRIATGGLLDDPDEAFSKETHVLDISYVDFDIAFVVQKPQENQMPEQDEETSGESLPARIVVN